MLNPGVTGLLTGTFSVNKYGRNPDIDQKGSTTAVDIGRDIWDGGIGGAAKWVPPTAARIHQVASSNDEDGGAGGDTGALTIIIFGLDSNFSLIQEVLALNGTTDVPTTNAYIMIHRMYVLTAGSAEKNIGDIEATADVDSTVTAKITAINGQTAMAIYQVPLNHIGYIHSFFGSLNKVGGAGTFADLALMIKLFGAVWTVHQSIDLTTEGSPHGQHKFHHPLQVPEKTLIKMVGDPSKDAQDMSSGFSLTVEYVAP